MLILILSFNPIPNDAKEVEIYIPQKSYESCLKAKKKTQIDFSLLKNRVLIKSYCKKNLSFDKLEPVETNI